MDGEQTESFTSFGQALDAAVAKRDPDSASAHQQTSGDGENGGSDTAHSTPGDGTSSTTQGKSGTSNSANGDFSVVAGNLGLAGELPQRLRAPFEVQQEISVPMDLKHGMQDSTGVLSRKLGLYFSLVSTQCSW